MWAFPRISCEVGGVVELHAAFLRIVHRSSRPGDMKRGISFPRQRVQQIPGRPILRAFCEGWDTTNLDTDRRLSHPLPRTQRMGHPPFRGASCLAKHQPRLIRELVSSQKAAHAVCLVPRNRKSGYAGAILEGHPRSLLRERGDLCILLSVTEGNR
jgi:hypothetical protein